MIDWMRLANILNPQTPQPITETTGVQGSVPMDPGLMDLLKPEHTAQDLLMKQLGSQPQRQDFPNTRMQNILASIAGMGAGGPIGISGGQPIGYQSNVPEGMKIKQGLLDQGFNRATADWGNKLKPISELADAERASNTNRRLVGSTLIRDVNTDTANRTKIKLAEDKAAADKAKYEAQLAQRDRHLEYLKYKQSHPDNDIRVDKEGRVYSVNPQTNKTEFLKGPDGSIMRDKDLGEAEQLELQNKYRLEQIAAQSKATQNNEDNAETNRETLEGLRYPDGRPKPRIAGTTILPSQMRTDLFKKAEEARNLHPEWRDYIILKQGGSFDIVTPKGKPGGLLSSGTKGGDEKVADQVRKFIYGTQTAPSTATKPVVRPDGKTRVRNKTTGQEGWTSSPNLPQYEIIKE